MIQFQGRTPEILPVSDYNDQLSEVHLQNPTNLSKRRLTYTAFEAAWRKNSQNKCVLITPQKLTETDIQNVLGGYLSAEAFQQVNIRSRLTSHFANRTDILDASCIFIARCVVPFADVLETLR